MVCAALALSAVVSVAAWNVRINHAGRILGPVIPVTAPTLFNTATADDIMSAVQLFPVTNSWNEDVSALPVLSYSDAMIAVTIANLSASRRYLDPEHDMNFILVDTTQPLTDMLMVDYPDESDQVNQNTGIGSYPFPTTMLPLEGWPRNSPTYTVQVARTKCSGDCHSIIFQSDTNTFWESWQTNCKSSFHYSPLLAWHVCVILYPIRLI